MSAPVSRKFRILVVDDQPVVRDCMLMLLVYDGHEVKTADSGPRALEMIGKDRFDLIFTDYSMPGMRGDELAATIRERAPGQPIVMVTADAQLLRDSGQVPAAVDSVIDKPFTLGQLRDAIARMAAEKSLVE